MPEGYNKTKKLVVRLGELPGRNDLEQSSGTAFEAERMLGKRPYHVIHAHVCLRAAGTYKEASLKYHFNISCSKGRIGTDELEQLPGDCVLN